MKERPTFRLGYCSACAAVLAVGKNEGTPNLLVGVLRGRVGGIRDTEPARFSNRLLG